MVTYLTDSNGDIVEVPEETTLAVDYSLTDDAGQAATLTALTWTLTDPAGAVINNRTAVVINPPDASGTIALAGDDLAMSDQTKIYVWRVLTLNGTYNSDLGSGLALVEEVWFRVVNLVTTT